MSDILRPELLDYYPSYCDQLKHIKGTLYESYMHVSEETIFQKNMFETMMKYNLAEIRSKNFFVKSIYCKYRIMSTGSTIYAFELVKLKEPVFHHSINTVNGSIRARRKI